MQSIVSLLGDPYVEIEERIRREGKSLVMQEGC
jgi:hypothetical protein